MNMMNSTYIKVLLAGLWGALATFFCMRTLPVSAQIPFLSAPPISCIECHKSQGDLFKRAVSHHPNAITAEIQIDYPLLISMIRGDCMVCHLYDPKSHTKGLKVLVDPDPTDSFIFNSQSPNTNNLCLSCHDTASEQTRFFSTGNTPPEIASMWMSGAVHNNPPIACNNCHNPHGSSMPSLKKNREERLCYDCHADLISDLNAITSPGHKVEGVDILGMPTDILDCSDCHNPHLISKASPLSNPHSQRLPYLNLPLKLATEALIDPMLPGRILSGNAYFIGNLVEAEGIPLANQFCLECHAPLLLVPPRPIWEGAADISFELLNKYWDPMKTVSNFHYNHDHDEGSCFSCHDKVPSFTKTFTREINGHYTHNDNASCTYCHNQHSSGSFEGEGIINTLYEGELPGSVIGAQRGHILSDWILVNKANVEPLPFNDMGYKSLTKNGARSCFINDPLNYCHDVSYRHAPIIKDIDKVGPESISSCNTMVCHSSFTPVAANVNGILLDRIAPAPPY